MELPNSDVEVIAAELMEFGVAPWIFSRIGLFPLKPVDASVPFWTHETRHGSVNVQPGLSIGPDRKARLAAIPYGGLPRIFLIDLATEIQHRLKSGSENPGFVDLTPTISRYVEERLLLKRGSRNQALLEQIEAVARANITFTDVEETPDGKWARAWDAPKVASSWELWIPNQQALPGFEPHIQVSNDFIRLVLDRAIPVRRDLLAQLAGKPMAMDVLLWLSSITFWLDQTRTPKKEFYWDELFEVFAHDYHAKSDFVKNWKKALTQALDLYPDVQIEFIHGNAAGSKGGGLAVKRSPLLIAASQAKNLLYQPMAATRKAISPRVAAQERAKAATLF